MTRDSDQGSLPRVATGVAGLDQLLQGGLFKAGIYIISGSPGAGKTILGNQMCFQHASQGGRAVYVTLLAETHGRLLAHLRSQSFFDESRIGSSVQYVNGFTAVEAEGLDGLLKLLRASVRSFDADLLVLDGLVTASSFAPSPVDFKKFINELQAWVGLIGCTVLFLTSVESEAVQPEHTMVDGIIELRTERSGVRALRYLTVTKLRGGGFAEGAHRYRITSDGIQVFPRLESYHSRPIASREGTRRVSIGVPGLDQLMGGGVARGSCTLVLGSSGAGKTLLGLHFLAAGAALGERVFHFGFFENPVDIVDKAERLQLGLGEHYRSGSLVIDWVQPADQIFDELAERLLEGVRRHRAERLFIDGLVGFKTADQRERISVFLSVLVERLSALGVTTLMSEETRELFVKEVSIPTAGVSAIAHNILFLRRVEVAAELRGALSVMKTRDSAHDRAVYEFSITDRGLLLGEPLRGTGHLLAGGGDWGRGSGRWRRNKK